MSLETERISSPSRLSGRLQVFYNDLKKIVPEAVLFETYRTRERQTFLYNQGRTTAGNIVTYAKAGGSPHNYGLAFDISNVNFTEREKVIRELLAKNTDIRWGADFYVIDPKTKKKVKFPDHPHFEIRNWKLRAHGTSIVGSVVLLGFILYKLRKRKK